MKSTKPLRLFLTPLMDLLFLVLFSLLFLFVSLTQQALAARDNAVAARENGRRGIKEQNDLIGQLKAEIQADKLLIAELKRKVTKSEEEVAAQASDVRALSVVLKEVMTAGNTDEILKSLTTKSDVEGAMDVMKQVREGSSEKVVELALKYNEMMKRCQFINLSITDSGETTIQWDKSPSKSTPFVPQNEEHAGNQLKTAFSENSGYKDVVFVLMSYENPRRQVVEDLRGGIASRQNEFPGKFYLVTIGHPRSHFTEGSK